MPQAKTRLEAINLPEGRKKHARNENPSARRTRRLTSRRKTHFVSGFLIFD